MPFTHGKPEELVFDLLPLSYIFEKGHRIRLTITGADPREKDRVQSSPAPRITIYRDATHSSYITLPVIPNGGGHADSRSVKPDPAQACASGCD